ncbi:hypothetical protein H311_02956 [Anncaliia algerae PRA109]|nr:hypothetical protein H311_03056 [Anncaliia algerae PRA109]KCZ76054.1 hypothetical protein H311_02956 [Anncaliia algerae PRA109]
MDYNVEKINSFSKNYHKPYNNLFLNKVGISYKKIGEEAISKNEVGLLILAGGQGTRLGFDGPKGCYKIKKLNLSLFEIFITKIRQIENKYGIKLEKIVMTSDFTDEETRKYLPDDFIFLKQDSVQCTDLNNMPVNCFSANGNGGIFAPMQFQKLKCKILNVVGVDNILCNIIDPVAIGCFLDNNYEILSKGVTKRKNEKAGIFINSNGRVLIKEYDTINDTSDEEMIEEEQANILNHYFHSDFFKKKIHLDYHISKKKLKFFQNGRIVEIEGYKKELFIFDSFLYSDRVGVINVPRELEFSPLKNGMDKKEYNEETCAADFINALEIKKRLSGSHTREFEFAEKDVSGLK